MESAHQVPLGACVILAVALLGTSWVTLGCEETWGSEHFQIVPSCHVPRVAQLNHQNQM